jgi:multiple antibiotic resistance protein
MDLRFAATAFATAFTIIDPIGMIPMTIGATARVSPSRRNQIIDQAVLVAAAVIVVMGALGHAILDYLGITLAAFTIAGGILLLLIAIDMLFARPTGAKRTEAEEREAAEAENPAVFPLAIPMISGPGTIATVLLLVSMAHGDRWSLLVVACAYAVALALTWLCMRASTLLLRLIGTTGIHVTTRLLGIILAALAVQFVLNGMMQTPLVHHP